MNQHKFFVARTRYNNKWSVYSILDGKPTKDAFMSESYIECKKIADERNLLESKPKEESLLKGNK